MRPLKGFGCQLKSDCSRCNTKAFIMLELLRGLFPQAVCKNEGICSLHQLRLSELTQEEISSRMHTNSKPLTLSCCTAPRYSLFLDTCSLVSLPVVGFSALISQKVQRDSFSMKRVKNSDACAGYNSEHRFLLLRSF